MLVGRGVWLDTVGETIGVLQVDNMDAFAGPSEKAR